MTIGVRGSMLAEECLLFFPHPQYKFHIHMYATLEGRRTKRLVKGELILCSLFFGGAILVSALGIR